MVLSFTAEVVLCPLVRCRVQLLLSVLSRRPSPRISTSAMSSKMVPLMNEAVWNRLSFDMNSPLLYRVYEELNFRVSRLFNVTASRNEDALLAKVRSLCATVMLSTIYGVVQFPSKLDFKTPQ